MKRFFQQVTCTLILLLFVLLLAICHASTLPTAGNTEDDEPPPPETVEVPEAPEIPETIEQDIILHAGGSLGGYTYLNAREPFYYYYALGYRMFEFDCRLSSDGRIICSHEHENTPYANQYKSFTYDEWLGITLDGGYSPAHEEWLIQTLIAYPDVTFIIDPKGSTDEELAQILQRFETLEQLYNIDLSSRIRPEILSVAMWELVRDTTDFNQYIASLYRESYTGEQMLAIFDDERIYAFSLHIYCSGTVRDYITAMKEAGKVIYIFTPVTYDELDLALRMQSDGIYVDTVHLLDDAHIKIPEIAY